MAETKGKKPEYLTVEDAIPFFNSLLASYSGIFRVQSGLLQTIKLRYVNLAADPAGPNEVGDTAMVGGKLKTCTVAGSPGTWVVVGTQT